MVGVIGLWESLPLTSGWCQFLRLPQKQHVWIFKTSFMYLGLGEILFWKSLGKDSPRIAAANSWRRVSLYISWRGGCTICCLVSSTFERVFPLVWHETMDKEQQRGLGGNARVWQLGGIYTKSVKVNYCLRATEGQDAQTMPPCWVVLSCTGVLIVWSCENKFRPAFDKFALPLRHQVDGSWLPLSFPIVFQKQHDIMQASESVSHQM